MEAVTRERTLGDLHMAAFRTESPDFIEDLIAEVRRLQSLVAMADSYIVGKGPDGGTIRVVLKVDGWHLELIDRSNAKYVWSDGQWSFKWPSPDDFDTIDAALEIARTLTVKENQ
jgi:hypothetical protein